jgi:hypothetical protein
LGTDFSNWIFLTNGLAGGRIWRCGPWLLGWHIHCSHPPADRSKAFEILFAPRTWTGIPGFFLQSRPLRLKITQDKKLQ